MYRIVMTAKALEHFRLWQKAGNTKVLAKISRLLKDIAEHPYIGIGKPEALRHSLTGKWSRRITRIHRLIYSVNDKEVIVHILSMKNHYSAK